MELPDDPIQDGSQDPDGVPQQQQGEDIDNSDDEAPAAPASAPPVPPPPQPLEPPLKKARTSDASGTRLSIASSTALDEEQGRAPQPLALPPPPPVAPRPNAAQQQVLDLVAEGKNVFYTGSAGTGKSFTTKLIIQQFRDRYDRMFNTKVAVVAPTGIAAANVGGQTIHRATGVGVPQYEDEFGRIFRVLEPLPPDAPQGYMRERLWGNTLDHLIVDEVSMIPGEFWDRLDWEVRNVRSYGAMAHVRGDRTGGDFDHVSELPPFGGIQLIVCGDLLQLPPVEAGYGAAVAKNMAFDADAPARVTRTIAPREDRVFYCSRGRCFESRGFWEAEFEYVRLTECYRQSDKAFSELLDRIRIGDATALPALDRRVRDGPGLVLFPCNAEADALNARKFAALTGEVHVYRATDTVCLCDQEFSDDRNFVNELGETKREEAVSVIKADSFENETFLAIEEVRLKVGCPVLLLANITFPARNGGDCPIPLTVRDTQALGAVELFNGAQGVVVGWATRDELFARAKFDALQIAGKEVFHGVPKRHHGRWAAAAAALGAGDAKKAQATLRPLVEEFMTRPVVVAPGTRDEYVAAERHIGRRSCHSTAWLVDRLAAGDDVPVCQFGGDSEPEVVVLGELFEFEVPTKGVARRRQLPLRLAWALSVHKSQGMGLEQVRFDPQKSFDDGQVYVALSRATTLEGLTLMSPIQPKHLKCDHRAVAVVKYLDKGPLKRLPKEPPLDLVTTWERRPPKFSGPVDAGAAAPEAARPPPRCSSATYFSGHTIVFTGEPVHLERKPWEAFVERHGGVIRKSVSKKTTLLVECSETNALGRPTLEGRKSIDAREKFPRVIIMSETEFYDAIESGVGLCEVLRGRR